MKILLIEDDDLDAESVTSMLRRIAVVNFSVTRCDCLAGAVSHLEKGAFDVLLVDLGLPDSQGVGIDATYRNGARVGAHCADRQ